MKNSKEREHQITAEEILLTTDNKDLYNKLAEYYDEKKRKAREKLTESRVPIGQRQRWTFEK